MQITAEILWKAHRSILGGKSSATGAPLPERLDDTPPGAQAAHWGLAYLFACARNEEPPLAPVAVSADEAARIRVIVHRIVGPVASMG